MLQYRWRPAPRAFRARCRPRSRRSHRLGAPHTTQCRCDVICVGTIIFSGEGNVGLLLCARLCRECPNCLSVSAMQSHFISAVLCKGDSLSASTLQSVCNVIGEAAAIGLRMCMTGAMPMVVAR